MKNPSLPIHVGGNVVNTTYFIDRSDNLDKARNVLDKECEEITEDPKAKTQHSAKSNVEQIVFNLAIWKYLKSNV